jgi:hypothetical protein
VSHTVRLYVQINDETPAVLADLTDATLGDLADCLIDLAARASDRWTARLEAELFGPAGEAA